MRQSIIKKSHIAALDKTISANHAELASTPSYRQSISLLQDELRAAQKLLYMQQQDNYKCHDHIHILDSEVDTLRKLLDEKQRSINHLNNIIVDKDDKIKEQDEYLQEVSIGQVIYLVA